VVTVRTGETLSHTATLAELPKGTTVGKSPITIEGTVTTKTKSKIWMPLFIGASVVEAGLAAFTYYEWQQSKTDGGAVMTDPALSNGTCFGNDPDALNKPENVKYQAKYHSACNHYKLELVGWGGITLVGLTMIGSFVMAFIKDDDAVETKSPGVARAGHRKRRELAVTPVVTPMVAVPPCASTGDKRSIGRHDTSSPPRHPGASTAIIDRFIDSRALSGARSTRITTDFEVGVRDRSAMLSSGTSGLASGK